MKSGFLLLSHYDHIYNFCSYVFFNFLYCCKRILAMALNEGKDILLLLAYF
jgi:hypothetical protein